MSSIALRVDDTSYSKSKKDAHRERLAADIEAFMNRGGEIVTCSTDSEQVNLVDANWVAKEAGISVAQLNQALMTGCTMGVSAPTVHSYISRRSKGYRGGDAHFRKTDAMRFVELLRSSRDGAQA